MASTERVAAYRHELKYQITTPEYLVLRQRLRRVIQPDPHAGADGRYRITSLYFDNWQDKALQEKLDGISRREKFRIRWYNDSLDTIFLEKKQKVNSLCLKSSQRVSLEEIQAVLDGKCPASGFGDTLLTELHFKMQSQGLRPRTLVSYQREPYLYRPGNVRITFDMDLRSGLAGTTLDTRALLLTPVLDPGRMVLEVKYDGFLPTMILDILQMDILRVGAFSKYAACRCYE